jgi:hypothetical protein
MAGIPYCAPLAAWPRISGAPRLAAMNASPVIHAGSDRPERKKSTSVLMNSRATKPMPSATMK